MKLEKILCLIIVLLGPSGATYAQWTPWLDRDSPSGIGDFETLRNFIDSGQVPCKKPTKIQCQTLDGTDFADAGQVYSCTPKRGGVCINEEQFGGAECLDYRVRFLCGPTDLGLSADPLPKVEFGCGRFQSIRAQVFLKIMGGADPYTCIGPAANFPLEVADDRCVGLGLNIGIHTFRVIDSAGDSAEVAVTIKDVIESTPITDCEAGSATVSATSMNGGPLTFRWDPGDLVGPTQDPGPGDYEVLITDPLGCARTVEFNIPSPPC